MAFVAFGMWCITSLCYSMAPCIVVWHSFAMRALHAADALHADLGLGPCAIPPVSGPPALHPTTGGAAAVRGRPRESLAPPLQGAAGKPMGSAVWGSSEKARHPPRGGPRESQWGPQESLASPLQRAARKPVGAAVSAKVCQLVHTTQCVEYVGETSRCTTLSSCNFATASAAWILKLSCIALCMDCESMMHVPLFEEHLWHCLPRNFVLTSKQIPISMANCTVAWLSRLMSCAALRAGIHLQVSNLHSSGAGRLQGPSGNRQRGGPQEPGHQSEAHQQAARVCPRHGARLPCACAAGQAAHRPCGAVGAHCAGAGHRPAGAARRGCCTGWAVWASLRCSAFCSLGSRLHAASALNGLLGM